MFAEHERYSAEFTSWVSSRKPRHFGPLAEFKSHNPFSFEAKTKIKENDTLEVREIELVGNTSHQPVNQIKSKIIIKGESF